MEIHHPEPYVLNALEQRLIYLVKSHVHETIRKLTRGEPPLANELWPLFENKARAVSILSPSLRGFDVALPQMWLNHWNGDEYEIVRSGTVWAYPEHNVFGLPFPLTAEATHLVKARKE